MTTCVEENGRCKYFNYKRNSRGKRRLGGFTLVETKDKFEIWNLCVEKQYQRKGYATRMLKEFIAQFKANKPLVLYVYKSNKVAIHLYENVGFEIIGKCNFEPRAYEMLHKTH